MATSPVLEVGESQRTEDEQGAQDEQAQGRPGEPLFGEVERVDARPGEHHAETEDDGVVSLQRASRVPRSGPTRSGSLGPAQEERSSHPSTSAAAGRGEAVEDVQDEPHDHDRHHEQQELADRREDPGAGQAEEPEEPADDTADRQPPSTRRRSRTGARIGRAEQLDRGDVHSVDAGPGADIGEPDDIGKVALFLASHMCSYMTGGQIVVDGGILLT